jgi:hypothetical protein
MKKFKMILASLLTAASVALVPIASASAIDVLPQCSNSATTAGNASVDSICASKNDNIKGIIKNVVDILLYLVGAIAVIMLIVGGIRYSTSAGNSANVTAAKNTIMYALIGLVISVLAYVIVNFVILAVTTGKPA